MRGNHTLMFLSLFLHPFPCLKLNEFFLNFFKEFCIDEKSILLLTYIKLIFQVLIILKSFKTNIVKINVIYIHQLWVKLIEAS